MALTRPLRTWDESKDVAHAILDRLDRLIALLERGELTPVLSAEYLAQSQLMLRILVANAIPAAPEVTRQVTVQTTETALVENESQVLRRVDVTNLDPAQPLWVSGPGVLVTAGQVILPNQTTPFVVPIHESLWGIVAVATINVAVSESHDIFRLIEALGGTDWMIPQSWR